MNRTLNVSAQTGKVDFRSSQQYAPCAFYSCPLQARRKATAPFTWSFTSSVKVFAMCSCIHTHTHPAGQHYALCFPAISISILSKNTLVHFELGIEPTPLQLSNWAQTPVLCPGLHTGTLRHQNQSLVVICYGKHCRLLQSCTWNKTTLSNKNNKSFSNR